METNFVLLFILQNHERSASCNPSITSYMSKPQTPSRASSRPAPSIIAYMCKSSTTGLAQPHTITKKTPSKAFQTINQTCKRTPSKKTSPTNSGSALRRDGRDTPGRSPEITAGKVSCASAGSKNHSPKSCIPSRVTPTRKAKQRPEECFFNNGIVNKKQMTPSRVNRSPTSKSKSPSEESNKYNATSLNTNSSRCGHGKQDRVDLNSRPMMPNKVVSRKRKGSTPVKPLGRPDSPLRKVPRKTLSGKSFTVNDIYVDPQTDNEFEPTRSLKTPESRSNGLSELDNNRTPEVHTALKSKQSEFKVPGHGHGIIRKTSPVEKENKVTPCSTRKVQQSRQTPLLRNTVLKTPASRTYSFTPMSASGDSCSANSTMKVTPPLCHCGRRSKRRMVQSPGQNMGRFFFSCAVKKGTLSKDGCNFFKWETSSVGQKPGNGSAHVSRQFTPVVHNSYLQPQISQKKSLGVRANTLKIHFR